MSGYYLQRLSFEIRSMPKAHKHVIPGFLLILPIPFLVGHLEEPVFFIMVGLLGLAGLILIFMGLFYAVFDFIRFVKGKKLV